MKPKGVAVSVRNTGKLGIDSCVLILFYAAMQEIELDNPWPETDLVLEKCDSFKQRSKALLFLLKTKFPNSSWIREKYEPRAVLKAVRNSSISRPYYPQVDSDARVKKIKTYEHHLREQPHEALDQLMQNVIAKQNADKEAEFSFNQPPARADFAYWAQVSSWTTDEAIALSFGRDPRKVSWDDIKSCVHISNFVKAYADRRLVVQRAVGAGQLYTSMHPGTFVAWAKRMKVGYPDELETELTKLGTQVCDWKSLFDESEQTRREQIQTVEQLEKFVEDWKALHEKAQGVCDTKSQTIALMDKRLKELTEQIDVFEDEKVQQEDGSLNPKTNATMLTLIHAMAHAKPYRYDPENSKNGAIGRIEIAVLDTDLKLSQKTIRKYVASASSEADRLRDKNQ